MDNGSRDGDSPLQGKYPAVKVRAECHAIGDRVESAGGRGCAAVVAAGKAVSDLKKKYTLMTIVYNY